MMKKSMSLKVHDSKEKKSMEDSNQNLKEKQSLLRFYRYLTLQRSRLTKLIDVGAKEFLEHVE